MKSLLYHVKFDIKRMERLIQKLNKLIIDFYNSTSQQPGRMWITTNFQGRSAIIAKWIFFLSMTIILSIFVNFPKIHRAFEKYVQKPKNPFFTIDPLPHKMIQTLDIVTSFQNSHNLYLLINFTDSSWRKRLKIEKTRFPQNFSLWKLWPDVYQVFAYFFHTFQK